jgi:hypothetical protein
LRTGKAVEERDRHHQTPWHDSPRAGRPPIRLSRFKHHSCLDQRPCGVTFQPKRDERLPQCPRQLRVSQSVFILSICGLARPLCFLCVLLQEFTAPEQISTRFRDFDIRLTLSIPCNPFPPNPLHLRLREQFDTLSVYRGLLCERRAPETRAQQTCNDSIDMKNDIQLTQSQLTQFTQLTNSLHPRPSIGFARSSPVKPGKAW